MRFFTSIAAICLAVSAQAEITTISPMDLVWDETPEGVAFASLDGARFEQPYHAMVRLPGGLVSPPHVKTANMFGLMIQGEMIHYAAEADPQSVPKVGAGAFYKIPAGMAHISACVSETPCVTYLYQDGAFDFQPITN